MRNASGGKSDVGQQRANNEDNYRIIAPLNLFVISDGMGGEAHGEIASALAVETVVKCCMENGQNAAPSSMQKSDARVNAENGAALVDTEGLERAKRVIGSAALAPVSEEAATAAASALTRPGWSEKTTRLFHAAHLANKKIYDSAEVHPEQRGMGATLTAAWIDGEKLSIAHVGDSRAYLLRSGALQQLTNDHSLVAEQVRRGILTAEEAEHSEMQSVLLRALGTQAEIEVDADEHVLFARDILLLCTDGLTRMVTERDIAVTLQAEPDPAKAAEKLVALANKNGGADNVTVVVIRVESEDKGFFSWLRRGAQKDAGSNGSAGGM